MSSQGNGSPIRYAVRMSGHAKAELKERLREAAAAGKGHQFLAAVRRISERLRQDPLNFGEPLYRLPALRLLVCAGILSSVIVDFAVHEELPLVFVRGFKVLS